MNNGKLVIFSAPSGSGKTTIVRHLLENIPNLVFSISATSRAPRGTEKHGVDYYFLSHQDFKNQVSAGDFLEWEEVYAGTAYGTLRSEVENIWRKGNHVAFDIDVVGGLNLKKQFGNNAIAIYIKVPNFEELEKRLITRGTDSAEKIAQRLQKAKDEATREPEFDHVIINEDLEKAQAEALALVRDFLAK